MKKVFENEDENGLKEFEDELLNEFKQLGKEDHAKINSVIHKKEQTAAHYDIEIAVYNKQTEFGEILRHIPVYNSEDDILSILDDFASKGWDIYCIAQSKELHFAFTQIYTNNERCTGEHGPYYIIDSRTFKQIIKNEQVGLLCNKVMEYLRRDNIPTDKAYGYMHHIYYRNKAFRELVRKLGSKIKDAYNDIPSLDKMDDADISYRDVFNLLCDGCVNIGGYTNDGGDFFQDDMTWEDIFGAFADLEMEKSNERS